MRRRRRPRSACRMKPLGCSSSTAWPNGWRVVSALALSDTMPRLDGDAAPLSEAGGGGGRLLAGRHRHVPADVPVDGHPPERPLPGASPAPSFARRGRGAGAGGRLTGMAGAGQVLDRDGVGKLVKMATAAGKAANPKLKVASARRSLCRCRARLRRRCAVCAGRLTAARGRWGCAASTAASRRRSSSSRRRCALAALVRSRRCAALSLLRLMPWPYSRRVSAWVTRRVWRRAGRRLRLVLALPRPHRPPRRCPGPPRQPPAGAARTGPDSDGGGGCACGRRRSSRRSEAPHWSEAHRAGAVRYRRGAGHYRLGPRRGARRRSLCAPPPGRSEARPLVFVCKKAQLFEHCVQESTGRATGPGPENLPGSVICLRQTCRERRPPRTRLFCETWAETRSDCAPGPAA